jgi:5-formyltetrahydrofolate cyclo-ligase
VLVPGLAFDADGHRLGYGLGYYDRTITALREAGDLLAIGVAYAAQLIEAVPREDHDQPLDLIVTENGIFVPGA